MNIKNCIIRNYCPADFNNYLQFCMDANQLNRSGLQVTPKILAEDLNHPHRTPEKDIFIAEKKGEIIGFCELIPELDIGRVLLDALVYPRYRRRGIASELFKLALLRGCDIGAKIVHVDIFEANEPAKRFLKKHGFKGIRRYFELQLRLYDTQIQDISQTAVTIRPLRSDEENRLAMIQNHFFKGSWGYNPNAVEEVSHVVNSSGGSPKDIILCFDGDRTVGYCWTRINRETNARLKRKKGRIHMMGVDPDYRGRGFGKLMLHEGLCHLKNQGVEIVELTTDSKNTAACELYRSVGFEVHSVILWFERALH